VSGSAAEDTAEYPLLAKTGKEQGHPAGRARKFAKIWAAIGHLI